MVGQFSARLTNRVNTGQRWLFYELTDVQTASSTIVLENAHSPRAMLTQETDIADILDHSFSATAANKITLTVTAVSANDDGTLIVVG